jgi:anti-anti-sigma factor
VVVADRGRARIFAAESDDASLVEIESLACPEGASHPHDLVTDKRGYFKGHSNSMQTGDPETDFRHRAAQRFAHRVVEHLDEARQHNQFGELVLVAAPMFLGELRTHLKEPLAKLVSCEIGKDFTTLTAAEIAKRIREEAPAEDGARIESGLAEVFGITCLDDVVVITPPGDLGEFALEHFHTEAERALHAFETEPHKRHVVIDFKNTQMFGSSALGFFARLWKRVRARGGSMVLCNLSPFEEELLKVTKLDTLWPAYDSIDEAIDAVRHAALAAER